MTTTSADTAVEALDLRFDTTVDRRLVHKAAIDQVLLCDHRRLTDSEYAAAAQLPRSHRYYSDTTGGCYDTLLILEISRQIGVLVAHEYLGVPHGSQFVFDDLTIELDNLSALRIGPQPAQLVYHVYLRDMRYRRGELTGGHLAGDMFLDGQPIGHVHGGAVYLARSKYAALRKLMGTSATTEPQPPPPPPLPPSAVARFDPRNVVIAQPEGDARPGGTLTARVLVDPSHPTFFDHPLDHVPGNLLIESVRQTAVAAIARTHGLPPEAAVVRRCFVDYGRFAELGAAVYCRAVPGEVEDGDDGPVVHVDLELVQLGAVIGRSEMSIAFLTDRP